MPSSVRPPLLHSARPNGHDIKLDSLKTSVAVKSMIILHYHDDLITTSHRRSGKSKNDRKLTELDVLTVPKRTILCFIQKYFDQTNI